MKEIWLEFYSNLKAKWEESFVKYKINSKQAFQFLKEALISLIKGIYKWLYDFTVGNGIITIDLITYTLTSFGKMILDLAKEFCDSSISWIRKL